MSSLTNRTESRKARSNQQSANLPELQEVFTSRVLPRIVTHGRVYFRHLKCSHQKEEAIQEMSGLAWDWFVRLAQRGKDATRFVSTLATFAARHVRAGRRLTGQEKTRDVLSPTAQTRRGFCVERLPDFSTLSGNPLEEALHDNTVSPVPDQVAFRLDFPAWLAGFDNRRRDMIVDMGLGHQTQELATKYRVSEGRISQMRREAAENWQQFHGELV